MAGAGPQEEGRVHWSGQDQAEEDRTELNRTLSQAELRFGKVAPGRSGSSVAPSRRCGKGQPPSGCSLDGDVTLVTPFRPHITSRGSDSWAWKGL